jgi:tRNA(Arg) A34 adenosine deaminase TadA
VRAERQRDCDGASTGTGRGLKILETIMARPNVTAFVYDKKDNLLAVGKNSYIKTHPLQASAAKKAGKPQCIYLHAEIHALTKIRDWTIAHRIVVVRLSTDGEPLLSKPCPICQYVIGQTNIKVIEHT